MYNFTSGGALSVAEYCDLLKSYPHFAKLPIVNEVLDRHVLIIEKTSGNADRGANGHFRGYATHNGYVTVCGKKSARPYLPPEDAVAVLVSYNRHTFASVFSVQQVVKALVENGKIK